MTLASGCDMSSVVYFTAGVARRQRGAGGLQPPSSGYFFPTFALPSFDNLIGEIRKEKSYF